MNVMHAPDARPPQMSGAPFRMPEDGGPWSLGQLARDAGLDEKEIERQLDDWLKAGQLEVLKPIGHREAAGEANTVFYRVPSPQDNGYLWEQDCYEGRRRITCWRPAEQANITRSKPSMKKSTSSFWVRMLAALTPAILLATMPSAQADSALAVDPAIKPYAKTEGVSGNVNSIGSDTLNNLMALWTEGFRAIYPNVNIQVEGKGSSTAPPALIEGTAQLGPMSRPMKSSEIDQFEKKYGYKPTEIRVAIDALAVFAHKDNPVKGLTMQQVDSIFSSTFKAGGQDVTTWGQLGLEGDWANRPISLYGRNSASGTYGFFKEHALAKGDYKSTVKEQPGSSAVVTGIAGDLYGLGYSGIGYKTAGVRALPIGTSADAMFEATAENAMSGDYPLARFLLIYINKKPGEPMDKLTAEFVRYVLSKEGQEVVVKDGYFPMSADLAAEAAKMLD